MNYRLEPLRSAPLTGGRAQSYVEDVLGHPLSVLHRFPKYVYIEPINYCNARCNMCAIDFDEVGRTTRSMPESLFHKIVGEIAQYRDHVEKVVLYLDCEPLMDRRLHEKVRTLKAAGLKTVNIASNASKLNEKRAIELIDAGLDEIYFSIDSLHKETYEGIRVGLCFEEVVDNTLRFIRLRDERNPDLRIRIQAILQAANRGEGESIKAHWQPRLKAGDEIAIQRAHNWAGAVDMMAFGDEETTNHIPCISLWGTFCIHVDGDVGLCTMDVGREASLGNVATQTIAQIWAGAELGRIRDLHGEGHRDEIELCDGCTHWRQCKRDLLGLED